MIIDGSSPAVHPRTGAPAMEHRGYTGTTRYRPEENVYYGWVEGIEDMVTYEAMTGERLETVFRDAVDTYIETMRSCEEEPAHPVHVHREAA
jgi:predicted HicB family RNase H-like nuclease